MLDPGVVIAGGGQAGFQAAASLREEGYRGAITLVGEEPGLPYQRPPLSKGVLRDAATPVELRPGCFYEERGITVLAPERVTAIEPAARRVRLGSGGTLGYEHLIVATGARARMPQLPGSDLAGIAPLRTLEQARALMGDLRCARRVLIIGAGFIGLEVCAAARAMGLEVHVLEFADRALKRAVSSETADFLVSAQLAQGVQLSFGTEVVAYVGSQGRVTGVLTTSGRSVPADLVVVGIGVHPNDDLARGAGLAVQDGVLVDQHLLTCDPDISAIGDCARFPTGYSDHPVRLESVQNAVDHARCVAARLTGKAVPYAKVPWFWSDQGVNRLQIAGVAQPSDLAVVRGEPASGKFSVLRWRAGRLSAIESVNQAADHMAARKLLATPTAISLEKASDPTIPLASLVVS